ncbi:hypothetical protein COX58_02535 [archaeon CG_4_10_14_0_2_um_filter_Archaea_38_6]|nr:MAG: hypothetical protein COS83_01770 [archaeon CG07_land_8_20_14_0_80_38_8]PIU88868.1 MAG: hypothetical protein COS64_02255 [archaeon CG06_land_8_20_14_3_00_37_11]PJA22301.1 MAG: hypothetical protein COX58_02535 [archaeon CG_4_10_14_0_2_um_filter_Archaea_38_6]
MPIVGNTITEVRIKINPEASSLKSIQNNMLIKNVSEKKVDKNNYLVLKCDLLTTYVENEDKPTAQFMISEDVLFSGKDKEMKEMLEKWEKEQKLSKEVQDNLLKSIQTICMYDLQFFTNRMRFPPATGFNFSAPKEEKKGKKK